MENSGRQASTQVNDVDQEVLQSSLRRPGQRRRQRPGVSVSFREPERLPIRRYQLIVLSMCCYINFTSNMSFTILASFFDENATKHGLSKTQIGFIVAIYAGIATVGCPIFGIYLAKLGKKFTLIAGLMCASVCAGLFAF
ncbi:Oidioi.mRNA.OKI2018_I69.PAR.g12727.t1.cds [Oikopleura dioica]|uniref:Oidioi.mRNA.OKI2018_I69.PAR.g12727.t1.cds n=1 Tax=Oikopleura dioica TaxID=34765 RepID=A0ABN7S210_OIKDI|nr:Oidioi.mRNA.OKI2018_I69.PAR.g12727.t1.cds [Oikopleura dioica]